MANKIGCQAGKTKIVDPNNFGGQNSSSNIPVAVEDLNISVALTTFKKGRTVLTAGENETPIESSRDLTINFLNGSEVNGSRVLTTNYTDFTTLYDDNSKDSSSSSEALGITSIDIDFNSQIAPMITINFIDVKGSAIFQNEKNLGDGQNKYASFFHMPYPLFELTVKGYYGKPVKYCLHLTKFNYKFNSKTGNFEITTNFIGYTYAMLSDMLIGYLKAIPKTRIGGEIYKKINDERGKLGLDEILTLSDLMLKISNINETIEKTAAVDDDSFELRLIDEQREILFRIENTVLTLAKELDSRPTEIKNNLPQFDYIIKTSQEVKDVTSLISTYKKRIAEEVESFNSKTDVVLNPKLFDLYWNFPKQTKTKLKEDKLKAKDNESRAGLILSYLDTDFTLILNDSSIFDVWDLTDIYLDIKRVKTGLDENYNTAKTNLALKIKERIKETIGIDSTVRNIVEIFTTAVEVFMETIYTVSNKAEEDKDGKRAKQLTTKFTSPKNHDIDEEISPSTKQIFPWPDYREQKGTEGYVEKYLGENGVLDRPMDVEELEFISDLLNAFIKTQQETDEAQDILDGVETSWFPINPVDTKLFGITNSPYTRLGEDLTSYDKVAKLMLLRGMTYLSYSNKFLTDKEIENMAEIEVLTMLSDIKDDKIKQGLTLIDLNYFNNLTADIDINDGLDPPITRKIVTTGSDTNTYYTMFTGDNFNEGISIIPINEGFEGKWSIEENKKSLFDNSVDDATIFLTNYNNNLTAGSDDNDGGIYVKIFSKTTFDSFNNQVFPNKPESVDSTLPILNLEKLKDKVIISNPSDYGFNTFGGTYGIQEYSKMNFGNYDGLDLRYVFLQDNNGEGMGFARRLKPNSDTTYDLGVYNTNSANNNFVRNSNKTVFHVDRITDSWDPKNGVTNQAMYNIGANWANIHAGDKSSITYPFIEGDYRINQGINNIGVINYKFSLFGSRWYYGQSLSKYPIYSKALLFLSTIPWNGMPFELNEIRHLFDVRAGFIHVPKLWAAYVGGILWRMDKSLPELEGNDIIGGGSGPTDPIIWKKTANDVISPYNGNNFVPPTRNQSLHSLRGDITVSDVYYDLPKVLQTLPKQVKDEFKNQFFNFVKNGSVYIGENDNTFDFTNIDEKSRLVNGDINEFDNKLEIIYNAIEVVPTTSIGSTNFYFDKHFITDNFVNIENYQWIIPLKNNSHTPRQIALMYSGVGSDNDKPMGMIVDMMISEVIIANTNYHIWDIEANEFSMYYPVYCHTPRFNMYFNKVINVIRDKMFSTDSLSEKKQIEQEIFGTSDENIIKLQLYKTCKNTFDKWLGGVKDINKIIFQCGKGNRNSLDTQLATKYRKGDSPRLIDSFRFVDRSFTDIGDKLYVNPAPLTQYLINSPNSSFYDVIGDLLASNNFNFIALPTYINYNDPKILETIFEPYGNYEEAVSDGTCGPAFVSVYVGQASKHLDIPNSNYPNDGFDFDCNNLTKLPEDFANTSNDFENDVAVFAVNYSQQNQNIFKDVTLDQNEFSETAESLQVTDSIANKGSENNVSLGGQNIFNVYSVRSYKAEVEMMGNAMIQPMMHFQLNNIPMFHGAYLITRVKHSIQPNNMSTNFTGVRIRYPKTKLLEGVDFFMNIIDSIDLSKVSDAGGNGGTKTTSPIVATIKENGGVNSNIDNGNITTVKFKDDISGVSQQGVTDNRILAEAEIPLKEMLKAWIKWMEDNGIKANGIKKSYVYITSIFRGPTANNSNHGWGIAVDLQMFDKDGNQIQNNNNTGSKPEYFDISFNPMIKWLYDNSYKYGFYLPYKDGKKNEHWHWEYHGKSAFCKWDKNPMVYKYKVINLDESKIKPFVKNPKTKDGKEAVYTSCTDVTTKNGDSYESKVGCKKVVIDKKTRTNPEIIYKELKKTTNLSDVNIAGIMGNLFLESGFITGIYNPNGGGCGAYGMAQWRSERQTNLIKFVSNKKLETNSPEGQIGFINEELSGLFKYTLAALKTVSSIEASTNIFFNTYELTTKGLNEFNINTEAKREVPKGHGGDKRVSYARQFLRMIQNNSFSLPS
jgi:hypothetical protein